MFASFMFADLDYGFMVVVSTIIWIAVFWIFDPLRFKEEPVSMIGIHSVAYAGMAIVAGLMWQFIVVAMFVLWPLALYRKKPSEELFHLLVVYGDIEPALFGPYATFNEMVQAIPTINRNYEDDGMYYLIQSGRTLKAETFSGNELEKFYGAADGPDDVDPQFPSNRIYL